MEIGKDKLKKLDQFIESTKKVLGQDILFLPKFKSSVNVEWIPTGIHSIDSAFGGGIPRGRVIEIFGPESSGKTTLCLELTKAVQQAGYFAEYVDVEHALDPEYARRIGVDIDNMAISQPNSAEQALELVKLSAQSDMFAVIIVDSVAGLVPQAEIDGEIGDKHMALQAQLMSQALRQLVGICHDTSTTIIFTNQIRYKVGLFYGSPETQPGGNALKFYSSIRADIRKKDVIEEDKKFKGIVSKIKIVKNKVAPPFKEVLVNILFNKGIDKGGDLREVLSAEGRLVCRGGNYYIDGNTRIGTGKVEADKWLVQHYEEYEESKWDKVKEEVDRGGKDIQPSKQKEKKKIQKKEIKKKKK